MGEHRLFSCTMPSLRELAPIFVGALVIGAVFGLVHNFWHQFLGQGFVPTMAGSVAFGAVAAAVYFGATMYWKNKFSPIVAGGFFVVLFLWHTVMMNALETGVFAGLGHMNRNVIMFGVGAAMTLSAFYVSQAVTPNKTLNPTPS